MNSNMQVDNMSPEEVVLESPPVVEPPNEKNKTPGEVKKGSSWLVWFSVLGIILIFLFGGLFYLSLQMKSEKTPTPATQTPPRSTATQSAVKSNSAQEIDQQSANLKNVSKEDTSQALSRDINDTDLTGIDREMDQINSELDSSR